MEFLIWNQVINRYDCLTHYIIYLFCCKIVFTLQEHKINGMDLCKKLGDLYANMIFVNGFVHSDPHPGNILIRKDPEDKEVTVYLLDHGLYAVSSKFLSVKMEITRFGILSQMWPDLQIKLSFEAHLLLASLYSICKEKSPVGVVITFFVWFLYLKLNFCIHSMNCYGKLSSKYVHRFVTFNGSFSKLKY